MKLSTELKKARQECHHAEKTAQKWQEKAERKRQKVIELENLAKIDLLQKKEVSLEDLENLLKNLPSPTGKTPLKQEEHSDTTPEPEKQQGQHEFKEEYPHD